MLMRYLLIVAMLAGTGWAGTDCWHNTATRTNECWTDNGITTASTVGTYIYSGATITIKSVTLTDDGRIEVVRVRPSMFVYGNGGSPPGEATKEIYVARGGKIVLDNTVKGRWYPESSQTIPSRIEWK